MLNRYRLEWEPKDGGIPWIHEMDFSGDEIARVFAKAIAHKTVIKDNCSGLLLWRMSSSPELLARYAIRRSDITVEEESSSLLLLLTNSGLKPLGSSVVR